MSGEAGAATAAPAGERAITHRRVLAIALPIVISNATIPILGAVDTAVVGQLGEAAPIGAVGLGAVILATLYWTFGFLRMGMTGLVAQARGQRDAGETSALMTRGLIVAGTAGVVLIALQALLFAAAFAIAPASDAVEGLARDYLAIRIWGAPAAIAIYGLTGWLIAFERTRSVLVLQFWMNGVNVGLDVWFVLGLGWGVEGVAWATLIAEWSALGLGLWLCRAAFAVPAWRQRARVLDAARVRHMAQVNGDILVRSLLLQASFTTFLFLGAGLGDVTLAANQILLQFFYITAYALDGFAFAAEALVGWAYGARSVARLRRAALLASRWAAGTAALLALAAVAGGPALIDLMTTAPEVREAARAYLLWMALTPVLGVAPFMLDGVFIGATRTRDMRNAMVISILFYAAALAALVPVFGNHGLWAAMMVLFLGRTVTLALRYPALEAAAEGGK
jgi:multidrug resistance protein, MATE family